MELDTEREVTEYARAKLNISLDVLGKRPDGYHDLRMLMQSAALCDDVAVKLTDGPSHAESNRAFLPSDGRNSAVAAAVSFFEAAGISGAGVAIRIEKRIPVCAGLGGGSSDAAAVLRALNRLTGAGLSAGELRDIGAKVGSDVPFCVEGGTVLAEGRGERIRQLRPLPEVPAVICMPFFTVSTPELFACIDRRRLRFHPDTEGLLRAVENGDMAGMSHRMYNVFEDVLGRRADDINEIKSVMLDCGALGSSMSGTGSAVFGFFADGVSARRCSSALESLCREVFVTSTCGKTPLAGGEA